MSRSQNREYVTGALTVNSDFDVFGYFQINQIFNALI